MKLRDLINRLMSACEGNPNHEVLTRDWDSEISELKIEDRVATFTRREDGSVYEPGRGFAGACEKAIVITDS